jgi:hypothetical protein
MLDLGVKKVMINNDIVVEGCSFIPRDFPRSDPKMLSLIFQTGDPAP